MKKFNFKALVLIVLALVMVFALVACGENKDGPKKPSGNKGTEVTASDYFNALTDSIKSIGKDPITNQQDIYAKLGAGISLTNGSNVNIDLGIEVEVVYDRPNNTNSAARLAIIDKSGSFTKKTEGGQPIVELFYFLNDPTYIYANAFSQKIKLQFDATGNDNTELAGNLTSFLTSTFETGMFEGKSLDGFVKAIANKFGPEFTLDTLVDAVAQEIMGISTTELIGNIAKMINSTETTINGLLKAVSGMLISTEKGAVTKTTEGTKTVWSAKLGTIVNNIVGTLLAGVLDDQSNLTLAFTLDGSAIDELTLTGKTAALGTGANAKRYDLKVAITDFKFKGVDATTQPIKADGEFKEEYVLKASLNAEVLKEKLKLTFEDPRTVERKDGKASFKDICTALGKNAASFDIAFPQGADIQGKVTAEFMGKLSLANKLGFTKAYLEIKYATDSNSTPVTALEAIYQEVKVGDKWQGQVQIITTDVDKQYVSMIRDNLFVAMIQALYNAEDNADHEKYKTQIGDMFNALQNKVNAFELTNIQLQDLFQNIFFGEKKVGKAATEDEMKVISFVDVEKKAILNNYIKVGDKQYKLIKGEDANGEEIQTGTGFEINQNSPYYDKKTDTSKKVVYYKGADGNDLIYTYANLYKSFASGKTTSAYPVKFNIAQILNIALDNLQIADNSLKVATTNGIFNVLFGYAGEASATPKGDLNGEGTGYNYMGILETGAILSGYDINGYESISTAEELYAAVYKGSATAIKRLTDKNLLPAVKLVVDANGTLAYQKGTLVSFKPDKYNAKDFDDENRYSYKKEFGHTIGKDGWCYQTGYTINKAEAVIMWKVTANVAITPLEWKGIGVNDAPADSVVEGLYNEGIVKTIKDMLQGSQLIENFDKLNGNQIFDALLAKNVKANIVTDAEKIALNIDYAEGAIKVGLNHTVSTENTDVATLKSKVDGFAERFAAINASDKFVFDMSIWMPQA
ncbi:MAG: hypothetical protein SPD42_02215 [Eubacteriales bacterium]|nr:hypothetical protein [Eubacteriales bacterium]